MNDAMLPLPGLSPAGGKPVVVKFDGGLLSSDGGVLALREVERRLGVADRLAACVVDLAVEVATLEQLLDAHQLAHAHPSGSSADIIAGQVLPFAPEPAAPSSS